MSPCSSLQGGRALCPVCSLELQGPGECECEELAHTLFSRVSALLRASPGNPVPLWDGGGDVWTLTLQDSPLFCVEVPPTPPPDPQPALPPLPLAFGFVTTAYSCWKRNMS